MRILIYSRQKSHSSAAAAIFATKSYKNVEIEIISKDDLYAYQAYSMSDNVGILVVGPDAADALCDLREERIQAATIAVSSSDGESVVELLDAGYDDVVFGNNRFEEVLARFRKIWRISSRNTSNAVNYGPLTLYMDGKDPEVFGNKVKLTKTEYAILEALGKRCGTIVSREALFELVWPNSDKQPYDKVLDVHIFNLRKKLQAASGGIKFIRTLPLRGYFIEST